MPKYYPAFLDIKGKRAVVIGGGPVAARKAASLFEAGAEVVVISPRLSPEMEGLIRRGIKHISREYAPGDIDGAFLAIAATGDPVTNRLVGGEAHALGVLVNCANPPEAGNFIVPSLVRKGDISVAISTGGTSPAFARSLRKKLESVIGDEHLQLLNFLMEAREEVFEAVADASARARIMEELAGSGLSDAFRVMAPDDAIARAREELSRLIRGFKSE